MHIKEHNCVNKDSIQQKAIECPLCLQTIKYLNDDPNQVFAMHELECV